MSIRWALRTQDSIDLDTARGSGFECMQLPVEAIANLSDSEFKALRTRMDATAVALDVFEAPLPRGVQVTEQGFNTYLWTEYLGTAMRRLSELGCKLLAWGDGRSRLLPVEGDISTAKEHFYQFMFILCGMAERYGIEVCLGPLGARRTNFLNTLPELRECFSLIDKHNLSMLLSSRDLYEIALEPGTLVAGSDRISHVHLEYPRSPEGLVPPDPADGYDYLPFLLALRRRFYKGIISLPPGSTAQSLTYCKQLWEKSATLGVATEI